MTRKAAASVDAFEIYIIEDWIGEVSTRYYIGSSFHAQHQTRFKLHSEGKGNAKLLSEEMAKGDAQWTTRVIHEGYGTVIDAITSESFLFNKYKGEDTRWMLNRQDPLTQELTPEARRAAGLGLAATGYHQSEYGQKVHSELGKAAWASGTPEDRSERSRQFQMKRTPEDRSKSSRAGGLAGGRKGGLAAQAKLTPEQKSELGRMGGLASAAARTPESEAKRIAAVRAANQKRWHS